MADNINALSPRNPFAYLQNLSIKSKLLLLATTSVAIALALAFTGLATNDIRLIHQSKVDQLQSQAKMLAFNCTGVLMFQDEKATRELLASMSIYPTVEYACVFDHNGEMFADYRADPKSGPREPTPKQVGHFLTQDGIEIYEPISDAGEKIGVVYLCANMSDLRTHVRRYLAIGLAIMIGSLIGAGLFSLLLQRSISNPVNALASAAEAIKEKRDYSIRVEPSSTDEIGQLSVTFNDMLDEIQSSKGALQKAHDELEDRVEQRTAQLTSEIEQRKSIQYSLEISRDEAEAASRAKSEFLANMSHEIRTPLNGILGFTELLTNASDDLDPETRQEYLETIASSGRHLLELINDILDLSKIEAGQLEVELAPCSPHDVINQVVSVLRARAQQKGLQLKCFWSSKVPESIVTDGGRLRQLLMNLVGNAIKFTDQGAVTIDAELDHFRELLTIRVIDTGIGIATDKHEEVFSPFVQADNSVTRRYGGTGLGLAICQRLSMALGGELHLDSEEGQGSTFALTVKTGPLAEVVLLESPPTDALMGSLVDQPIETKLHSCRILLVEDGEINRKLVRIMLERAGATVTTAENGWVGVELAMKRDFDLIIMDMQMPVMDGYTATEKLRSHGLTTPILALTAHAMKGDEEKCLASGCTAYLTKPIQGEQLLTSLNEYLPEGRPETEPQVDNERSGLTHARQSSRTEFLSSLPLDNPLYQEIVQEFVDFLGDHVNQMRNAFANEDFEHLADLAHALKGAGGTAGFDVLTDPATKLQQSARSSHVDEITQVLQELSELTARITATPQVV